MAGWERAFETARLAKIPHLLYKEQWEKKQLQVRLKTLRYKISTLDGLYIIFGGQATVSSLTSVERAWVI